MDQYLVPNLAFVSHDFGFLLDVAEELSCLGVLPLLNRQMASISTS